MSDLISMFHLIKPNSQEQKTNGWLAAPGHGAGGGELLVREMGKGGRKVKTFSYKIKSG